VGWRPVFFDPFPLGISARGNSGPGLHTGRFALGSRPAATRSPRGQAAGLHVAMDELKRCEKLVGEKRGSEVKALHREIDQFAAELAEGNLSEVERQKYASSISEWWQIAIKWLKGKTK
jgi:hypothetical protein